jgi:hypothetical protein
MSGGLREQDWRESESANRAKDIRDERNAAARERASQYNAGLPQQQFTNALAKATGQLPSTSAVGNALMQGAQDARASAAGVSNIIGKAYDGDDKGAPVGSTYLYDRDSNNFARRNSASDISRGDDEK